MSKFALLFLAVFVGGTAAAVFYDGSLSFILYQLVYFLDPKHRWWGHELPHVSYSFFASVLMLLMLTRNYTKLSELSPWRANAPLIWLLAMLACYYLAYMWALDMSIHRRFTFDFMKVVVVTLTAYKLLKNKRVLDWAIWAYLIGCTYIGYLATITGRNYQDRVEGIGLPSTGGDVNLVSIALVPAGVLLLYFAWQGNKKIRFLAFACGALVVNGLVLFNSRGAFLGVLVSAGLYLLVMMFSRHRPKGSRTMAILVLVIAAAGALRLTDQLFWQRMDSIQKPESKDSGRDRIEYWMAALKMMKVHPEGMGIFGFNVLSSEYLDNKQRGGVTFRAVHSMWFQGLTEVGFQGFFCFLALLFTLYRLSMRARRAVLEEGDYGAYFKILALQCGLLGYLVSGTFINVFRTDVLYWMILLLSASTNIYYLQPLAREKEELRLAQKKRRRGMA